MNKLRQKLIEVLQGRNGVDELGRVLLIASTVLYILAALLRSVTLNFISLIGFIYSIYRTWSRDLRSRQDENMKFLHFWNLQKMRFEMRKEYRIFRCKGCGRNIRVPRGKGKLEITCPLCGRKVIHRT
ncbi:MAG: hypothetical protein UH211_02395 [Agathobacter sp.]|nr:hypothetical protein [Agathobacter sp.]